MPGLRKLIVKCGTSRNLGTCNRGSIIAVVSELTEKLKARHGHLGDTYVSSGLPASYSAVLELQFHSGHHASVAQCSGVSPLLGIVGETTDEAVLTWFAQGLPHSWCNFLSELSSCSFCKFQYKCLHGGHLFYFYCYA